MLNVVAAGSRTVEMFKIKECTSEAFEEAMKAAGWEYDGNNIIHKKIKKYANGCEMEEVDSRVSMYNVCVEQEMAYTEYKKNYSGCQTKKGSYNKEDKTIVVYVRLA